MTSLSTEFNERTVKFRGRTFRLRELSIGDYDDIAEKSMVKKTNPDGSEREYLDERLQSRLMLNKAAIDIDPPLPASGFPALGTAVIIALNRVVMDLHYGAEPDELKVVEPKAAASDDESDGEAKGKA